MNRNSISPFYVQKKNVLLNYHKVFVKFLQTQTQTVVVIAAQSFPE